MTDFTGSNAWHTTITGPSTAQDVTAASVNDPCILIADRTIWLKERLVRCLRSLEHVVLRSSSYAEVLNLVTALGSSITTFADVPGFEVALSNAVLAGDVIECRASLVAGYKGGAISTDRMELAITGAGTSGIVHVVSSDAGVWGSIPVHHTEIRSGSGSAPTVKLRARCATSGKNDFAQLWGPWEFSVRHLRRVDAP